MKPKDKHSHAYPHPECEGCELYWWSGRNQSIVYIYGTNGAGNELEQRVKCKRETHYCRHPQAKLYELPAANRWFCTGKAEST